MPARKEVVEEKQHRGMEGPEGGLSGSGVYARKPFDEHRKHKRFQVPQGVYVGFGPNANKVGQIVDVSMGGLAYRYVGSQDSPEGSHLDIFASDSDFYLGSVPYKTVSDFEMVHHLPSSRLTIRRSGVQFGKLTPKQSARLEYFILHHTLGEA